jgi:RNA polymerase sigma-70 factor (ECF subfamily)
MNYAELLKNDNETAFRRLHVDISPALRYFASRYVSDRSIIDDIVQDAFVSLWEHRATMPEGGSVRAYLYSSVRFACMNYLRHSRVRARFEESYEQEPDPTFLDNIQESEIFSALLSVFDELPPACRETYTMSLGGMSHKEIADKLGITINTVKKHKNNANHFLRHRMKNLLGVVMQLFS